MRPKRGEKSHTKYQKEGQEIQNADEEGIDAQNIDKELNYSPLQSHLIY